MSRGDERGASQWGIRSRVCDETDLGRARSLLASPPSPRRRWTPPAALPELMVLFGGTASSDPSAAAPRSGILEMAAPNSTLKSVVGSSEEIGFAKLHGENFEYDMLAYSVILGRNTEKSKVDLDLCAVGDCRRRDVSRHHARIFYDFEHHHFALEVLGKQGCTVQGVLHLQGSAPVKLNTQDLIEAVGIQFYFLLPHRSIQASLVARRTHSPSQPQSSSFKHPDYTELSLLCKNIFHHKHNLHHPLFVLTILGIILLCKLILHYNCNIHPLSALTILGVLPLCKLILHYKSNLHPLHALTLQGILLLGRLVLRYNHNLHPSSTLIILGILLLCKLFFHYNQSLHPLSALNIQDILLLGKLILHYNHNLHPSSTLTILGILLLCKLILHYNHNCHPTCTLNILGFLMVLTMARTMLLMGSKLVKCQESLSKARGILQNWASLTAMLIQLQDQVNMINSLEITRVDKDTDNQRVLGRADKDADNQHLLLKEEKDVVAFVATEISELCGPGQWVPMAELHSKLLERYGKIWPHRMVQRYLSPPLSAESVGKPWCDLLPLLRKHPEHFVTSTLIRGEEVTEHVGLISPLS
ncbi:hypothetical protein ACP4OV_023368 [Aristida adscensionis]